MRGKIKKILDDKGYGFLERKGQPDIFFLKADLPQGESAKAGDTLEFDEGEGKNGKPQAINLKVVGQGEKSERKKFSISASWTFEEPIHDTVAYTVPVWVKLVKGKFSVQGMGVKLYANGEQVDYPSNNPSTDSEGMVFFGVGLDKNVSEAALALITPEKTFTSFWKLKAPEAKVAKYIKATELDSRSGTTTFSVLTQLDDKPDSQGVSSAFEIRTGLKIAVEINGATQTDLNNLPTNKFGAAIVKVTLEPTTRGDLWFALPGTQITSGPHYIRNLCISTPGGVK
jgi:cold shock CspA family protein